MDDIKKKLLKRTLINLAKEHKKTCESDFCGVDLILVAMACGELNIKLTKKEYEVFMWKSKTIQQ